MLRPRYIKPFHRDPHVKLRYLPSDFGILIVPFLYSFAIINFNIFFFFKGHVEERGKRSLGLKEFSIKRSTKTIRRWVRIVGRESKCDFPFSAGINLNFQLWSSLHWQRANFFQYCKLNPFQGKRGKVSVKFQTMVSR